MKQKVLIFENGKLMETVEVSNKLKARELVNERKRKNQLITNVIKTDKTIFQRLKDGLKEISLHFVFLTKKGVQINFLVTPFSEEKLTVKVEKNKEANKKASLKDQLIDRLDNPKVKETVEPVTTVETVTPVVAPVKTVTPVTPVKAVKAAKAPAKKSTSTKNK